ncbi:LysR family transcriptional regulator [Corallococcus carmarthensis]|uniref:LysR family transcriptional regulator n=1 Tax=Corallococcus carmarthensis TaxID=2316728 RepID=A0A3A8JTC6_9BACT|nr:LysR family transcriptional regulator [Corallococcus carmarthensis]NOK18630.1 LysR family transcriptional regulator [Corallococcus carmarthensis]RKG99097.1 LysR family transcriptional regulator [Corallococcus carmarthensis]
MAFTPLNALNAFIAVARKRSFAVAARELGVSTSALSQSVRQLEERLETPLLTRTSRSVALTEAGQRLLDHAGPAVEQALEALQTVKARRGEVTGRVRLTVPTAASSLVLDRLIPRFVERHPKVELEVSVDNRLVDPVAEGFDAGIRLVEAIHRDMVHIRLTGPCRVVVAGAPSYLDKRGTPQKPADLLHHDCLVFRLGPGDALWAWELERGKKTVRIPVRGPVVLSDNELRRTLAIAGVGLTYGLEPTMSEDLRSGRLRVVLPQYAPTVPGLFLYFPNRAQVSPALRAFVTVARELASSR